MFRLFSILYAIGGTTLAGSAMVVALTTGHDTLIPIVAAAAIGALIAVPICWIVARRLTGPSG